MEFVLADPLYNVLRDRNNDHAEYDVLGASGVKDMPRNMEDLLELAAHGHVFYSALQYSLWYRAFALRKRNSETVPGNVLPKAGLKAKRARAKSCSRF